MRSIAMAVFAFAVTFPALDPAIAQDGAPRGPRLTLPDGTVLPLPRHGRSFGPDGPLFDAVPQQPGAADDAPDAPTLPPHSAAEVPPPSVEPTDPVAGHKARLDELYGRLAHAADPVEAGAIAGLIGQEQLRSGSATADLLMSRAVDAMGGKDNATALRLLDALVKLRPGWAEAWNKRATVRFLEDDDVGAMADIGQTLVLEPRHFGALSGMGLILRRNGDNKDALTVLHRAAAIDPQNAQVKQMIEELDPAVQGQTL